MRRRLLDLCLLAYPRPRRERDRDYLRDLSLDLSETYGVRRQALSLVRGGLTERMQLWRRRRRTGRSTWRWRVVVAMILLPAAAFAASSLSGGGATGGVRVEADRFVCVGTGHLRSRAGPALTDGAGVCAETRSLVATRLRDGWECVPQRHTRDGVLTIAWRCSLGQTPGAWSAL